jgi:hypothetical protein
MAAAFVKRMTPGTRTNFSTTVSATAPVGGVAQGNRLLVGFISNNASGDAAPTCADSKGNVYASDVVDIAGQRRTVIFSAPITVALLQNDLITATFTNTQRAAIDVLEFSGLLGLDVTGVSNSTGPTVGSTTTPQRNYVNTVQFGVCGWNANGAGETFTAGAGFLAAVTVEPSVAGTWRDLGTEYRILSAGGNQQADGSISSATNYAMLTAIYIDATQPSAGSTLLRSSVPL